MSDAVITSLIRYALETLMWITAPMLVVAIVVGIVVSIVQNLTSIQDQTFSFAPRVVIIFVVFLFAFPWILHVLVTFTSSLFSNFTPYIK
jgi:flagellar biosynthetic protein FliQ